METQKNTLKNITKYSYFSHDSNARNDEKILMLRMKYGWEGYGIYFGVLECFRNNSQYKLKRDLISGLAFDFNCDEQKLNEIINYCIEIKLFKSNKHYFWSDSFLTRMNRMNELIKARRDAGKKGADARYKKNDVDESNLDPDIKNNIDESDLQHNSLFSCTLNEKIKNMQTLFIQTLGRNPNHPESDATELLIKKFGIDKVYKAFRLAGLNRFQNIPNIIKRINSQGEFILEDDQTKQQDDRFDRPIRRPGE